MTRLLSLSFSRDVLHRHTLNAGRAVAVFAALAMGATAAQGDGLSHTFVAGAGNDSGTCGRDHPCATFKEALSKTSVNGEVICLDKGNFGPAIIKMSVSIDCHDAVGSVFQPIGLVGSRGIAIDFASFHRNDHRKTVNLRGLNVQGLDGGADGILITDSDNPIISIDPMALGVTGGSVFIEDCVINGESGSSTNARGISDTRSQGGDLYISDTTIRNMGKSGIGIFHGPAAGTPIDVTIDNSRVQNANYGLAAGPGARVTVNRSVFSGNTTAGIEADLAATVVVNDSVSVHNGIGVQSAGSVLLSNSDISFNTTGVSGVVNSLGNNRFSNNTVNGMLTPLPPGSGSVLQ